MRFLTIILTFAAFSFTSFGQDAKADAILDKLSAKIKAQKSFYVEFSSTVKNSSSDSKSSFSGKGWVKGDKYYASFGDNTVISNGIKTWTVIKEEKTVYVTDADEEDEESVNPKKLMTIWETGFKSKYSKKTTIGGESVHMIYLYPKNAKVDYTYIVLYVSVSTNELKRVVMSMRDQTKMTYSMKKFTSNPSVADSKFVFSKSKYPGYTVIED
ncbi:MAG: outer membrane lipoprotein carrier protein LolA [Crocinitomicaceae bacterium]